jgi:hypothetical protein
MSQQQFVSTIAEFKRQLAGFDSLKLGVKACIGDHRAGTGFGRKLLRRVVNGVLADPVYGPDSALYRAMGYVRASERKSPPAAGAVTAAAPAADAGAPSAPAETGPVRVSFVERLEKVLSAWNEIAPEGKFGGMTMADFQFALLPYTQARDALGATRTRLKAEFANKAAKEKAARKLAQRVVDAIRSDEAYGVDSSLYRAIGYRPVSERRSPKRAASAAPSQPVTSPVTATAPEPEPEAAGAK